MFFPLKQQSSLATYIVSPGQTCQNCHQNPGAWVRVCISVYVRLEVFWGGSMGWEYSCLGERAWGHWHLRWDLQRLLLVLVFLSWADCPANETHCSPLFWKSPGHFHRLHSSGPHSVHRALLCVSSFRSNKSQDPADDTSKNSTQTSSRDWQIQDV